MSDLENSDPMIEITSVSRSKLRNKNLIDNVRQNFVFILGIVTGACGLVSFYYTDQIAREKMIYATISAHETSNDSRFDETRDVNFEFEKRLIRIEQKLDDLVEKLKSK